MSKLQPKRPLIAIIGATGTGKSDLAISLAKRYGGEIVNSDALQLYKGLPLATNKATPQERQGVPHHLLDLIRPEEQPWTIHRFHEAARTVIADIRARSRIPILIGGSHYYVQSLLLPGSALDPPACASNETTSKENEPKIGTTTSPLVPLNLDILEASTSDMYNRLREIDPDMASQWHPSDRRKIRRSLEIFIQTRRQPSKVYQEQKQRIAENACIAEDKSDDIFHELLLLWKHTPMGSLQSILENRVDEMVNKGLIEEARQMHQDLSHKKALGYAIPTDAGISSAIGFKEFVPYLETGMDSQRILEESVTRTKITTRQYARNQIRWIRSRLLPELYRDSRVKGIFVIESPPPMEGPRADPIEICQAFLQGERLPDASSRSSLATELLSPQPRIAKSARHCDLCDMTLMDDHQWSAHIKGKAHRRASRNQIPRSWPIKSNNFEVE